MTPVPSSTDQGPDHRTPEPKGRLARWLWAAVLVVVLGAGSLGAIAVGTGAWQLRPVLSGSMRPDFPIGSVLLAQRVPTSSLRVGDVAVLHPPGEPDVTYVHRIVWLEHRGGTVLVRTRGIANPIDDPWTVKIVSPVSYEGKVTIPYLGYAAVWVHSGQGRRTLLLIAAAALAACTASAVPAIRRKNHRPVKVLLAGGQRPSYLALDGACSEQTIRPLRRRRDYRVAVGRGERAEDRSGAARPMPEQWHCVALRIDGDRTRTLS